MLNNDPDERDGRTALSTMIILLFILSSVVNTLFITNAEDVDVLEDEILKMESTDIPTWITSSYWAYDHEIWYNYTDSDDWIYLKEELTYTVDAVEYLSYNETEYYGYNLTLEGEVLEGEGEVEGISIDITGGVVEGYIFCKMSDLGVVIDAQHRHIEGQALGNDLDIEIKMTNSYQPVVEDYDFPLSKNELFWANTTMRSKGYYSYDAGWIGNDTESFDENITVKGETTIPATSTISVPAGSFDVFNLTTDLDEGYKYRWYSPEVQSYVKEVWDTEESYRVMVLKDFHTYETTNKLSFDPYEAYATEEITVYGEFPEYPEEDITIWLPEGAIPSSEWSTTTDEEGYFSKQIEVPLAEDNTETLVDFASVGFVAHLDEDPEEEYVVSTLVIHHDNRPLDPLPRDGEEKARTDPELSVYVVHTDGKEMGVSFYDASDDTLIGEDKEVASGSRAKTVWDGLEKSTSYSWYAEGDDGETIATSNTWSFTTADHLHPTVELTSPSGGETWFVDTEEEIRWEIEEGDGEITHVSLEYSTDGGEQWEDITSGLEGESSYLWTIPDEPSEEVLVKVYVEDENELTDSDMSRDHFAIAPLLEVTIISPEEGEVVDTNVVLIEWDIISYNEVVEISVSTDGDEWTRAQRDDRHTFGDMEDGENTVYVRVRDENGREDTDSVSFIVDTIPPDIKIISPLDDDMLNHEEVTIQWETVPNITEIVEYNVSLDGEIWEEAHSENEHTLIDLDDGLYTVHVRVKDEGGHTAEDDVSFMIDRTPPSIEITSPEEGERLHRESVLVEWRGEDDMSGIKRYEVRVNQDEWIDVGTDTSYELDGLDEGEHTVEVRAHDRAGNTDTVSVEFTFESPLLSRTTLIIISILLLVAVMFGTMYYLGVIKPERERIRDEHGQKGEESLQELEEEEL